MPSFNNEKLLDIVTKRLVSSNAAPTLSRPDSDIFWRVMSDDIYRQLCGNKGSAGTVPLGLDTSKRDLTVAALQRKIGAPETLSEFSIPRVRIGVGAFYLTSQPCKTTDKKDVSLPTTSTGPIGISVYEDYLVKYNLKCRRHIAARQLPDGTAQPTDINAPRMYFEAANALTSLYGRTACGNVNNGTGAGAPPFLALPRVEGSLRPASSLLRPMSGVGSRPSSSASSRSKTQRCILDDLPTLRQALCRKFVQTVVEVIGELGSDPNNNIEIVLHPKVGTLKIRSKVVSLILADSGQEADGDPAASQANRSLPAGGGVGAGTVNRKRHHGDRELRLALESVARGGNGVEVEQSHQYIDDEDGVLYEKGDDESNSNRVGGGGGKPPLIRAKAPMSNKMRLILQKREEAKREKDYVEPISDEDSAFSGPSMNERREQKRHQAARESAETREQHDVDAMTSTIMRQGRGGVGLGGGGEEGNVSGGGESPLESVRRMKITNKFEPKIDHESIQRYREQQRPSSTSSSLLMTYEWLGTSGVHARKAVGGEENRTKTLQHLDAKLAALRSQLNDPLDELERNTYGNDYVDNVLRNDSQTKDKNANKLESPAATRDRKMREYEEKYVLNTTVKNSLTNSASGVGEQLGDPSKTIGTYRGYASATAKRNATRGNPILGISSPSAAAGVTVSSNSGNHNTIVPASKILELNFASGGIGDPNRHVAAGANRRFFSLKEQDVSTVEDIVQRRSERISNQIQHGRALKAQSKLKNEKKEKETAADVLIQKKETEVQVLSEALAILDKMRQKRETATITSEALSAL